MTAKDIMAIGKKVNNDRVFAKVEADLPVLDVIPKLLESKNREVEVVDEGESLGIIDETSLLEGLGRLIAPREDCSVISLECAPQDYCASVLAHAVEDSDAHLVDLLTAPSDNGKLLVTLRVRHSDPTAAVRSLERYGFQVAEAHSAVDSIQSIEIATERLLALQAMMNV